MGRIFISYRREDSDIWADRLGDALREHFPDRVFMDIREIGPGLPWRKVLDDALADCAALLVVIGPGWVNAKDANEKRRLEDLGDTLRREVAEALKRKVRVFPLRVNGADMPNADALPDDLKELIDLPSQDLTVKRWDDDVKALVNTLKSVPGLSEDSSPLESERTAAEEMQLKAEEEQRRNTQHGKNHSTVRASETGQEERQDSRDGMVTWRWPWIAVPLILISIVAGTIIYTQSTQEPETFKDCDNCPEMVVVPAGSFLMGSPSGEPGRKLNESPQRKVTIDRNFAVSKYEITRGQFAHFLRKSGYDMSLSGYSCWPDRESMPSSQHPVVCVNWQDAKAYAQWLTKKTGKSYRLLSEAEWEYAARAGTATVRYWGDDWQAACEFAQVSWCGSHRSAPIGQYRPNEYGLYDMLGNVWEWVEDCWNDRYNGAPTDGSALTSGQCEERVLRGGPFVYGPHYVRSARRAKHSRYIRNLYYGIRLATTLP